MNQSNAAKRTLLSAGILFVEIRYATENSASGDDGIGMETLETTLELGRRPPLPVLTTSYLTAGGYRNWS